VDARENLCAICLQFCVDLNIGERHGQVHPRQSGLSGRVHIGARHAAPCDGDCLGQHDSNGGDLFNLSRPHGRSSGLDLIHTRAFQSERDGELLLKREGHARRLFSIAQGGIVDYDLD